MVWLLSILLVLLSILCYLLFAPFYLEINTESGFCEVRFYGLAKVGIRIAEERIQLYIHVAGYKKLINTLGSSKKKKDNRETKKVTSKKNKSGVSFRLVVAVIRSFRVRKCYVSVDTGDCEINGQLFPLFFWISELTGKPIRINFLGENIIILELRNSIANMLYAYIVHYSSNKKYKSWKTQQN